MSSNLPPGQLAPDNLPPIFRQLAPDLQTTGPQYENTHMYVTLDKYIFMLIKY